VRFIGRRIELVEIIGNEKVENPFNPVLCCKTDSRNPLSNFFLVFEVVIAELVG
jgi:hypothetical protein